MNLSLPRRRFLSLLGVAPLVGLGCSEAPADTFDRNAMLTALADNVFVPAARAVATSQTALATATTAFADSPGVDALRAARSAWRAARVPLKRAQAFQAGPMDTLRLRSAIDWFPGDTAAVDRALAATTALTAEAVEVLGANQRGMPAVEYLLFPRDVTDDLVVASFTSASDAARRRDFLRAVGAFAAQHAEAFAAAWDRSTGNYAAQLSTAGRGSTTFTTTRAAVDLIVNQLIASVDSAATMRLGAPLGTRTGGVPQPDRVESPWSDASLDDLRALIQGVDAIYTGTLDGRSGQGIRDLVRSRNAATDDVVRMRTIAATNAVTAIRGSLREAVVTDQARVQAALDAVRDWKRTLQVDVANLLGVTVTFSDNDGD